MSKLYTKYLEKKNINKDKYYVLIDGLEIKCIKSYIDNRYLELLLKGLMIYGISN